MQLTFIGTGSAFTTGGNYQSNLLVEVDGKRLLIDCGGDVRHGLHELGLSHRDIDAVYISHLHADHVGGMEWLAFSTFFDPSCERPALYMASALADPIWQNVLSGGLNSLEGRDVDLTTYFDTRLIPSGGLFVWQDIPFQLVQAIHVSEGYSLAPCYGLLFPAGSQDDAPQVWFTGDTQYAPDQLRHAYMAADVIFHDCETSPYPSGVHPHFDQLAQLPDTWRSKMWLYHYQPGELPNATAKGFRGFVHKGQSFDTTAFEKA